MNISQKNNFLDRIHMLKVLPERSSLDDVVKKFYSELPTQIRHLHWCLKKMFNLFKVSKHYYKTRYCT